MRSLVTAYRDLIRVREIYAVLVRHGFGELASRLGFSRRRSSRPAIGPADLENIPSSDRSEALEATAEELAQGESEARQISRAVRVRLVAQDLGPSFVKLGQIASTRRDVLPADIIAELKKLQDSVPPVPFDDVRKQVETSLARSLDEVFDFFDEAPLAAASIGQVHRAVLRTAEGPREVVVKVQRPGVAQTVARDLELLHGLAALIERTVPESHAYGPVALVESFDRSITAELDYSIEADNARRFQKNFEGSTDVRFPRVYREASSKHVVALEYLPGKKIDDALASGHSGPKLARVALGALIKQIFEDGFFHADPHPGNVLILGEPDAPILGFIDLGMVGRLSPDLRDKTIDLMIAAVREDAAGLADALYAIGTSTRKVDMRAYRADVATLADKYLGKQLGEIELSALVRDLVLGAAKHGLEIPPDFVLVGKALMTLEGVGKEIDPQLDIFAEARPYFLDLLRKRYAPERLASEAWRGLSRLSEVASGLPLQTREILDDLRLGRLEIKSIDPSVAPAVDRLGRRLFSGLLASSFAIAGAVITAFGLRPTVGYGLFASSAVVLIAHLFGDIRRKTS